jgi:hypothetical protein
LNSPALQIFNCKYKFLIVIISCPLSHPGKEFIKVDGKTMDYAPTLGQLAVAAAMRKFNIRKADETENMSSTSPNADFHGEFVVNVGDNFYPRGVTEVDAKQRFHNIVEAVYGRKPMTNRRMATRNNKIYGDMAPAPVWYTIAGNNDYNLPEKQQRDMLKRKVFTQHFKAGRTQVDVQIAYTDKVDIW